MTTELISTNFEEIQNFWAKMVYPYAAPITETNSRLEPDPVASGVRVTFNADQHLVTAAHVIKRHLRDSGQEQPKGALYSFVPKQVEIEGEVITAEDRIDLAIIRLPATSRPGLRLPQHLAFDVKEGERCLFVGFQARLQNWDINMSRLTLRPRPLSYMGTVLKPSDERFSIRFNEKHLYRGSAKQNAVGKLNGISGAGVFVLRNDKPRLAGIVIEHWKHRSEIIVTSSLALWSMFRSPTYQNP